MARILLVDDDPATLDLIGRALSADGHDVIRCLNGQDALQQLGQAPASFELVLTDLEMPGLDGLELARRAAAAAPKIRILLMSGFVSGPDQITAQDVRIAGFVSKPLSLEQIRTAERSALA